MAEETREEREQKNNEEILKAGRDAHEEQVADAKKARDEAEEVAETEEEYYERIANVPGVFGDLDTDATTVGASATVVSRNEEAGQVAMAEAAAEGEDVSEGEAKRQVDVAADSQPSAEEVEAGADETTNDEGDRVEKSDEEQKDDEKAADKAAARKPSSRSKS